MSRFFSFLGSVALGAFFLLGLLVSPQIASATESCQFGCQVTLGAGAANCNPHPDGGGLPTVPYTPCATQCRAICEGAGMGYAGTALPASTCRPGVTSGRDVCSPCTCIPNAAIACISGTSGGTGVSHPFCASQCSTTCAAKASDVARVVSGSTIQCAAGQPGAAVAQCVLLAQDVAIRVCRACITSCVNDTSGGAQRPARTCYTVCSGTEKQNACAGVSITEANVAAIAPTDGATGGAGGSSPPGTPASSGAAATQGSCNFACKAQVPAITCTTDTDCATPCQTACSRSFRNGQCVTTGTGAARCVAVGSGTAKQCVFECSIGASQQERSCNPQGTDAQAPGRVCGSYCQETCSSASTQQPPPTGNFCAGSAPTCVAANTPAPAPSTGGSTGSSGASGPSGAGPGTRLINPLGAVDSIADLVGRLIKGILGVIGSVALLMFVYGGIKWILSAGEQKEVTNAQHIIRNATIGLVLIFFSYTISSVVLGFLAEVGGSSSGGSTTSQTSGTTLATCVEYAVTHGHIGRNQAQDTTAPDWACRETAVAERTNRGVCITNGCPGTRASVLCCAPVGGSAPTTGSSASAEAGSTGSGTPAPAPGTPAPTPGAPAPTPTAAATGCRTRVAASFHLRPTETPESVGPSIPAGTSVDVLGAGTTVRSGTLMHHVRVVGGAEGYMFLTPAEVAACRVP